VVCVVAQQVCGFASLVDYQHLLFWLVIGNQHSKESVDFTAQKIYAKVTRPFFLLTQIKAEKSSLAMQDYYLPTLS